MGFLMSLLSFSFYILSQGTQCVRPCVYLGSILLSVAFTRHIVHAISLFWHSFGGYIYGVSFFKFQLSNVWQTNLISSANTCSVDRALGSPSPSIKYARGSTHIHFE